MKLNTFFVILFLSSLAFSKGMDGISSPDEAAKNLFNELKKGAKGIPKALEGLEDQNTESYKYANKLKNKPSFESQIKEVMTDEKQGRVTEYKLVDETIKLDGDMVKRSYEVKFMGGDSRTIQLIFIRPTIKGNLHLSDIQFTD